VTLDIRTKLFADCGGTFAGIVLQHGGRLWTTNVLTIEIEPEQGVLTGARAAPGQADITVRIYARLTLQNSGPPASSLPTRLLR
jgi:hypothetical protein